MEQIFQVVGYYGPYQKYLFIINLLTSILPCVYSIQVAFMTKYPSFFVKILQGEEAGKIIEMYFNDNLCNLTLYSLICSIGSSPYLYSIVINSQYC